MATVALRDTAVSGSGTVLRLLGDLTVIVFIAFFVLTALGMAAFIVTFTTPISTVVMAELQGRVARITGWHG